jgi:uncharacterized membrane protein YphA (DoxX/SURF4 family)
MGAAERFPWKRTKPRRLSPADPLVPDLLLLRLTLGFVYFFFGFLKFFPDLGPAELLGSLTVMRISSYGLNADTALRLLAILECAIAVGFLFQICLRLVSVLFFLHMLGTFLPLLFLPELTFKFFPFAPTLEGQYILKNLVFLAAGWTILVPHLRSRGKTRSPSELAVAIEPTS